MSISKPTAKKCIFVYFTQNFEGAIIDSVAKNYDLIVMHDSKRWAVSLLRERANFWHQKKPLILVYKDCMTIIGPGNPWGIPGDRTIGGGATIGGFWHFDSTFWGYGLYNADTSFLMRTDQTSGYDSLGRVKGGSANTRRWRWVMDWGNQYWADFYACTSKVQCLRNFRDTTYDSTYFDGIFMDNVLHFNKEYRIYPQEYWISSDPARSDSLLQDAIYSFLQRVYVEYHNQNTPSKSPREILAIGNTNKAFHEEGLWERYLDQLDGGMEESFVQTWQNWQDFDDWKKMVYEIEYAESKGKICLAHTGIDSYVCTSADPLSVTWFDSTQMMYGFTSFLMGFDSTSYFSFQGNSQHFFWAPILDIDIGKPVGAYLLREDSLAYRHFEKGIVFCNPTTADKSVEISVKQYFMVKPSGDTIFVKKLKLKPYHGAIFKSRK